MVRCLLLLLVLNETKRNETAQKTSYIGSPPQNCRTTITIISIKNMSAVVVCASGAAKRRVLQHSMVSDAVLCRAMQFSVTLPENGGKKRTHTLL